MTSDGGTINLCIVSPTGFIRDAFEHLGLASSPTIPASSEVLPLIENATAAAQLIAAAIGGKPFDYWREHLKTMWASGRHSRALIDLASDEQAVANDMIVEVEAVDGGARSGGARTGPVQSRAAGDHARRRPEHTGIVLMEIGLDWDRIQALKFRRHRLGVASVRRGPAR